jgi:hypothetical protein
MHFEVLVEEISAAKALNNILPKIITKKHTFRIMHYHGKKDMLKNLPVALRGYSKWIPPDYKIIILMDQDKDDCIELKALLEQLANNANLKTKSSALPGEDFMVLNRIAVEELEAWLLGDTDALRTAYPKVSRTFERTAKYRNPDTISGTWEALERLLQHSGYFKTGLRKSECATAISMHMQPLNNRSRSFHVFWEGISHCLKIGSN